MGRTHRSRTKSSTRWQKVLIIASICISLSVIVATLSLTKPNKNINISESAVSTQKSSSITLDRDTGEVLNGENIHTRLPMASTTKIMTALLAVQSGKLEDIVTISPESSGVEGSSIYLKAGEKYKLIDLVYGLMLRSGNDAADAIARFLGGNIANFAKMMNDKANKLSLLDTHFVNPHGLHDDNHYTSAYDLAMITREAMSNPTFRQVVASRFHKFTTEDGEIKVFVNKNKLLKLSPDCVGVKTGYTKKAGRCYVSAFSRDGLNVITVVLNHPDMWQDSLNNFNAALADCERVKIINKCDILDTLDIDGNSINVGSNEDIYINMRKNREYHLSYEIQYEDNILECAQKGENIGKISIFDGKHLLFEKKLYKIVV